MSIRLLCTFLFCYCYVGTCLSQTKNQIEVLNSLVQYILTEEKIDTLLIVLPFLQLSNQEPRMKSYSSYNLPIDSITFSKFTMSMPDKTIAIWPKLILPNTKVISQKEVDSFSRINFKIIYKEKRNIPDSCKYGAFGLSSQMGVYSWFNFSNPVFSLDNNYAFIRLFQGQMLPYLSNYEYFLLQNINGKWGIIARFGTVIICH